MSWRARQRHRVAEDFLRPFELHSYSIPPPPSTPSPLPKKTCHVQRARMQARSPSLEMAHFFREMAKRLRRLRRRLIIFLAVVLPSRSIVDDESKTSAAAASAKRVLDECFSYATFYHYYYSRLNKTGSSFWTTFGCF